MSPTKGVRKRKETRPTGIRIGRRVLPSEIAITVLMVLLYAWLLLGGAYERNNIITQAVFFALFLCVVFLFITSQKVYSRLGLAFTVLAIPPLAWNAIVCFGYMPAAPDIAWFVYIGLANLLLGTGLVIVSLYYEKGKLSGILVQPGNLKQGLVQGGIMLVASVILAAIAAYVFFDAGSADMSGMLSAFGALLAFAIACGFVEELMFRGLLLSRLLPLVSDTFAIIAQAFAFAVYEGIFMYLLTSNPFYSLAVSVVAAALGAVWAWMAIRDRSIIGPALSHAGIYLILALPIFAAFF